MNGGGILQRFLESSRKDPSAPFLDIDGVRRGRQEFLDRVRLAAAAFRRRGISRGDAVALQMPNRIEWCEAFWGLVWIGAVPVPLDPQLGAWEAARLLEIVPLRLVLAVGRFRQVRPAAAWERLLGPDCVMTLDPVESIWEAFLEGEPLPEDPAQVTSEDLLLLAFTSGTTGNPKLLEIPHWGFLESQAQMADWLGLGQMGRLHLGMPLFHQGGFGMGLQVLLAGGCACYSGRFDPGALAKALAAGDFDAVQLSPTLAKLLLTAPEASSFRGLKLAYFAGELLPHELAREFWERRGIRTVNIIGSSETGTMVVWDSQSDRHRPANEFRPLPFTRAQVLTPEGEPVASGFRGHLWVASPGLLRGYRGNPALTERSFQKDAVGTLHFDTGDLVERLEDGWLRFVGRAKRVIKRGPNLVHPEEIEAFLLEHPSVQAVSVVGVPDALLGEAVVARIQPNGPDLDAQVLQKHCRGNLSGYKIPDRFVFGTVPHDIGKARTGQVRRFEMSSMDTLFEAASERFAPERIAFESQGVPETWGAFVRRVRGWTAILQREGLAGKPLAYSLPNSPDALALPVACSRLGCCVLPFFPRIPDEVLLASVQRAGIGHLLLPSLRAEAMEDAATKAGVRILHAQSPAIGEESWPEASFPSDLPALLTTSSGTTGQPKPVRLTRENVSASLRCAMDFARFGPWQEDPSFVLAGAFPLSTSGVMVLLGMLLAGVRLRFSPETTPQSFAAMGTGAQVLAAPPAHFEALLLLPREELAGLSSVIGIQTGMDHLSEGLLRRLKTALPSLEWVGNGYGLVETATVFLSWQSQIDHVVPRFRTCPSVDNRIEVRDPEGCVVAPGNDGMLWVRGESVFPGYGQAGEGLVDGWFCTGDAALRHEDGIELLGRQKYVIKRGGRSVFPFEVEACLQEIPGVRRAVATGVPHPLYGQMIWAFLVPEGADVSLAQVMRHCRERLPAHSVPDQVRLLEAIPEGRGAGKVDREALVASALEELSQLAPNGGMTDA